MWLMGSEGRFVRVNQAAADLLGYRRGELEAMGVHDVTPPGTGEAVDERLRSLIDGKARRVDVEKQYVCKDGSLIWAEVNASPVRDDEGAVRYVMGQVQNVTARHEAEEGLRRSRDLYRLVAENSLDLIALIDLGGSFLFASSAYAHLLGYEPAALVGTSSLELLHPDDRAVGENWFRVLPTAPTLLTLRVRRADGSYLPVESHAGVVRDDDGAAVAYLAVSRDITHTLRNAELEDQLRHAQKLEAVGRLAGGIAHDFNNLLLAIRGFAELGLRHVEARDDSSAELGEIVAAVEKAAGLTRQLLAFSRRQVMNPQIVDLREVVADMATLLRRLIGTDIELDTVCPDQPVHVRADRTQLEQVIANLSVNARDAMQDGGQLTIEVARHSGHALLVVRDDGTGMDAATGAQIFEPFFSTKGSDGTGLGLSTVHGIVSQTGGRIEVDSAPGRGTTFTIFLPLTAAEPTPRASVAPAATAKGSETILLVEDDPGVRFVVAEMLAQHGYVLVTAESGEEAREIARAERPGIDLLLTDLVMSGIGGQETAAAVLAGHPQAKVLYMSGYNPDAVVRVGESGSAAAFIQKPFAGDELARRVRALLDADS